MSVLDIGTGRGETAGLLTHRLGRAKVTTVDVDGAVSREARDRLAACGLFPAIVYGDGLSGDVPGAFDRVLITCGPVLRQGDQPRAAWRPRRRPVWHALHQR
ncbi:methyltransferase domain-containing protein [Streptomyces sp. T-3]|nr:methyltransferase domain-containing protein [Streptomyces sp. T-3]